MESYLVKKQNAPINIAVTVPGSKSITNRALLLAALAEGTSVLRGVLFSEDSRVFMKGMEALGFQIKIDEAAKTVEVTGQGGKMPNREAKLYVGSAGTAARFLTALTGLSEGRYHMDASEQMKKRPMKELLVLLEELGAEITYLERPYTFPFIIQGAGNRLHYPRNRVQLNIDRSSQFLSAILLVAPMLKEDLTVELTGGRSAKSYVEISEGMMKQFSCDAVEHLGENTYRVLAGRKYISRVYQVEPDVSAACYFYAMALLLGGRVKVNHVTPQTMQGDKKLIDLLVSMGAKMELEGEEREIVLTGPVERRYPGVTVDMSDFSDQTMTLAALAVFAEGDTEIRNVAHIRQQESNRLLAIITELARLGIACEELEDGIRIHPGEPKAATIQTYEDHRMAMAFSLIGLRADGIRIANPACTAKTFADYFEILDSIT